MNVNVRLEGKTYLYMYRYVHTQRERERAREGEEEGEREISFFPPSLLSFIHPFQYISYLIFGIRYSNRKQS